MNLEHALRCIIFTGLAVLLSLAGTSVVVADTAVRFLLEDAPYVTGETINVDGGRSIAI